MSSLKSILRSISQPKWIFRIFPPNSDKFCARTMSTMIIKNNNSSSSSPPWLMLPPTFEGSDMVYNFYSLAEKKEVTLNKRGNNKSSESEDEELLSPGDDAQLVGSSHGWLALFDDDSNDLFLSNPLSRRHVKLPPIHTLPQALNEDGDGYVEKVIISCSPLEQDCHAMMMYRGNKMAFCRPGHSAEWTPIGARYSRKFENYPRGYEDIVYSRREKLFYCVSEMDCDDLEGWDVGVGDNTTPSSSPRLVWSDEDMLDKDYEAWLRKLVEPEWLCRQMKYLVVWEEDRYLDQQLLLLVTRHVLEQVGPDGSYVDDEVKGDFPHKTISFDVHRIDREGRRLSYIEGSLDGLAVFVGLNHSFAMPTAEFPGILKPNCIYFTEDKELTPRDWVDRPYGGHDVGIFDYGNRTVSPCYYPCDAKSIKRIYPGPLWFTPSPH